MFSLQYKIHDCDEKRDCLSSTVIFLLIISEFCLFLRKTTCKFVTFYRVGHYLKLLAQVIQVMMQFHPQDQYPVNSVLCDVWCASEGLKTILFFPIHSQSCFIPVV